MDFVLSTLRGRDVELKALGVRKGAWSKEEDELLRKCIEKYGEGKWSSVPKRAGLKRCRKSCRLRWLNYLSSAIHRGKFSNDEIDLIVRLHKLLGNRWSLIAGRIPGRTANDIKNFWNSHLRKKCSLNAKGKEKTNNVHEPINSKAAIVKPQPHRISKSWNWPQNIHQQQQNQEYCEPQLQYQQEINSSNTPPMINVEFNEENWLRDLMNPDHSENVSSNLDFHFGSEMEEIMDEAMFMRGVKEWEKTLEGTVYLDLI